MPTPESALVLPEALRQHPLWPLFQPPQITWPYLAGLWDADGHISVRLEGNGGLRWAVTLAQSNQHILSAVFHFLAQQGITAAIYSIAASGFKGEGTCSHGSGGYRGTPE